MLVLQLLGALMHRSLEVVVLSAKSGFEFLLPEGDLSLSGHHILPCHQEGLLLPHEHLELLVIPFAQLQTLVLQLLVHLAGGLTSFLELLSLLTVPGLHFLHARRHGLHEGQIH